MERDRRQAQNQIQNQWLKQSKLQPECFLTGEFEPKRLKQLSAPVARIDTRAAIGAGISFPQAANQRPQGAREFAGLAHKHLGAKQK